MKQALLINHLIVATIIMMSETAFSQSEAYRSMFDAKLVGNVYGTVIDLKTNEPINDAEIFLLDQPVQQDSVGGFLLTKKGKIRVPDLKSAVRNAKTNVRGEFLVNFVPTPFPSKYYTIFIQASGYNKLIINQARVLPGAVMALKVRCKLEKGVNESFLFEGNDKDAPTIYHDEESQSLNVPGFPKITTPNTTHGVTYTIFATREGLIGGTTANGHVIVPHDHFVSLPSRRALNANDQTYDFQVRLTYGGRTVIVPVWELGPWNIYDDHYNPESIREIYSHLHHGGQSGLGEGLPEAQAAYQQNYNQGWSGDHGGSNDRQIVLNPAGIDLADGTFWDNLLMTNNDWVSVNYLWRPNVAVGNRVQATSALNVRSTPGGSLIGQESSGSLGTITDGPQGVLFGNTFYVWWKIQWDDGLIGWSVENYIQMVTQTLSASLTADPQSSTAPLNVTLTATGSGTAQGTFNYTFWWDCNDPSTSVAQAMTTCGSIPTPGSGSCSSNGVGNKCDAVVDSPKVVAHTYSSPGTYTAKVIIERGSATPAESRVVITVNPPTCYTLTTNVNPSNSGNITVNTSQNCTGGYTNGSQIGLSATPVSGYNFSNWSGTGGSFSNSSSSSTTFTISGNAAIAANFVPDFWQQTSGPSGADVYSLAVNSNGHVFAGTASGGIYMSTDNGGSWNSVNAGLTNSLILSFAINSSSNIFAGTGNGIFQSLNNGGDWTQVGLSGSYIRSLAINSNGYVFCGLDGGNIGRSTNNGGNWDLFGTPAGTSVVALAINSSQHIFAGTLGDGVYKSTDNGIIWSQMNSGLTNTFVWDMAINSTSGNIFAATDGGVYRSTNNGASWTQINNGLTNTLALSLAINSNGDIFASTQGGGVFRSTDNGINWVAVNSGLTNTFVRSLVVDPGNYVYAGTSGDGVFRSSQPTSLPIQLASFAAQVLLDNTVKLEWTTISETNNYGFYVERKDNLHAYSTISSLIPGAGTSLEQHNYSWTDSAVTSAKYYYRLKQVDLNGDFTYSQEITVSNILGIQTEKELPKTFVLEQNYPNPFNPSTTIKYALPKSARVLLSVYNTLGQRVAQLVDEQQEAGYHEVNFSARGGSAYGGNAIDLPSGVYFYRLQARQSSESVGEQVFVETRKLLLMK